MFDAILSGSGARYRFFKVNILGHALILAGHYDSAPKGYQEGKYCGVVH
jgi:hypothetical protein